MHLNSSVGYRTCSEVGIREYLMLLGVVRVGMVVGRSAHELDHSRVGDDWCWLDWDNSRFQYDLVCTCRCISVLLIHRLFQGFIGKIILALDGDVDDW